MIAMSEANCYKVYMSTHSYCTGWRYDMAPSPVANHQQCTYKLRQTFKGMTLDVPDRSQAKDGLLILTATFMLHTDYSLIQKYLMHNKYKKRI